MHLVGFIIRMYHDTRSSDCQTVTRSISYSPPKISCHHEWPINFSTNILFVFMISLYVLLVPPILSLLI